MRSKTSILGPLKMKTWQALSCVQIRGVFLDFCPIHYKDKEEVLDGTKHTCLEDTHPRNILTERNGKRKHACTCTHICTLFDFALHKVIYYGTWRSFTNTHTHTKSECHQSFVQLHDVALQEGSWREGCHEGDTFNLKLVQRVVAVPVQSLEERLLNGVAKCAVSADFCNLQAPVCTPVTSVLQSSIVCPVAHLKKTKTKMCCIVQFQNNRCNLCGALM